ncbi:MAG TPA: class I SAM-dependent methyltransferase [Thermomonospora sp.]|nr:class I SAM-dependent methyltransferase [Thermomonospora sp.]
MVTTACFLCGGSRLTRVVDLGLHPLADTFLTEERLGEPEIRYPLTVVACGDCGHLMTGHVVPATIRYQASEYSYTSSNSAVAVGHFDALAEEAARIAGLGPGDLAVDVGSNVGTLLARIAAHAGCRVLGVDPSPNIARLAERNGVPTIADFLTADVAAEIRGRGRPRLVTGTNVCNHVEDQHAFARDVDALLAPDGVLALEVPYAGTLVEETSFDTIYLEHVSYFFLAPLRRFWAERGFRIFRVSFNAYMGGSMRVYLSRHRPEDSRVAPLVRRELERRYFAPETYEAFTARTVALKTALMNRLYGIRADGGRLIGIGAATKGNTLLNFCGIDGTLLAYVTDASPLKVGKYTPGSRLRIRHDDEVVRGEVTHGLILPWNIRDLLGRKFAGLGIELVVPHLAGPGDSLLAG